MFPHLEQITIKASAAHNVLRARLSIASCPLVACHTSRKLRLEKNVHLFVGPFVQNDLIKSLMSQF